MVVTIWLSIVYTFGFHLNPPRFAYLKLSVMITRLYQYSLLLPIFSLFSLHTPSPAGPEHIFATPVSGTTTFNSLYSGSFVDLTGIHSAGGAGLLASNVAGYNVRLIASSGVADCGIGIEPFGSPTALVYGYTNNGLTNLTAFELSSNDGKIFDLQSVAIITDGQNVGTSGNMRLVGYFNGSAVAGANLTQSVTNASFGGTIVTFTVSANSNFVGIDKFRVEVAGAFTISGAIGVDNVNAINFRSSTLPVSLVSYNALPQPSASVLLSWRTASETGNSHFNIERSADGANYNNIGRVKGRGSFAGTTDYSFTDATPLPGKNYYRLQQVDADGKALYLGVRTATVNKPGLLKVYANPARGNDFTIRTELPPGTALSYILINASGKTVLSGRITQPVQTIHAAALARGIYVLKLSNGLFAKMEKQ